MKGKGKLGVWCQRHCNSFFRAHQQVLTLGVATVPGSPWVPARSGAAASPRNECFILFALRKKLEKVCWISKWGNSHCPYPTANCSVSSLLPASPGDLWALENMEAGSEQAAAENGLSCHGERNRKMVKNNFLLTGCVDRSLCLWYLKAQQDKFGRVIEYEPINLQNAGSSRRAVWVLTNEPKSDSGGMYLSVIIDLWRSSCSKNFS